MPPVRRDKLAVPCWCTGRLCRQPATAIWPRARRSLISAPPAGCHFDGPPRTAGRLVRLCWPGVSACPPQPARAGVQFPAPGNLRTSGPLGTGEVSAAKSGIAETRSCQIRAGEVRTSEVCGGEMRTAKVRSVKLRLAEIRTVEERAAKVRTTEERPSQVRNTEAGAGEIRPVKPGADKVRVSEVNGPDVALRISLPYDGDGGLTSVTHWSFVRADSMISRRPRLA